MAYGIVKQSCGHIEVDSSVGRGTTFRIFLPRVTGEARSVGPAEGGMTAPTGTETILLVEDEQMVRELARRILRRQGYVVLEADHGAAALAVADEWTEPIHLLLTDLVLPDIDGRALAKHMAERRPEMGFLYMSGYSKEPDLSEEFRGPDGPFLPKPFGPVELAQRVRAAIDQRSCEERAVGGEGPLSTPN
jgi:DNA-binding NtrC family response regulator